MAKIGLAGFLHETNTFAPGLTEYKSFAEADAWPGLTEGSAILPAIDGVNLACTGFVDEIKDKGIHQIIPLLWCSANPSGLVSVKTFNQITNKILYHIKQHRLDALYLDLHGAMVAENYSDGEGELLARIRAVVGPEMPIIVSLDFHANLSKAMLDNSDCLVAYREYPHVDMADTGRRAAILMSRMLAGEKFYANWQKFEFLLPLTGQCTTPGMPTAKIMDFAKSLQSNENPLVQFVPGFALSDTAHTGPSVLSYAVSPDLAQESADKLYASINKSRKDLVLPIYSPEHAIEQLIPGQLTIFADTQDNPGGGGSGDTVGILHALRKAMVKKACVGVICDPAFAALAHKKGVGGTITAGLGANTDTTEPKFDGDFHIKSVASGNFVGTGPFYLGCRMELGPMTCVNINGIDIVVSSRKQQAADQAMFNHVNVDLAEYDLLVLKSSVHFRADFSNLAKQILVVESPGVNTADLSKLNYQNLPENISIMV